MNIVETYIRELLDIRRSGEAVKETSYYPPLSNLFNAVGKTLKPEVRCIINIKNRGSGIPDAGLFTNDQLRKVNDDEPFISQLPARGVIEAKGMNANVQHIVNSEQVSRYLDRYGQVLVTNFIDFVLVTRDANGQLIKLEAYQFAESESVFLAMAANPRKVAEEQGERFVEYLRRVILYAAPLTTPEDVAMFLASYARDARIRIMQSDLAALRIIRLDLEKALGIKFEGKKGEHFFRSTLIQTIFYGIFSAWVLWCKQYESSSTQMSFSWREAVWYLQVPMIKALFEEVVTPTKLGSLKIVDILDRTGSALNRVDRTIFFTKFEDDHAVQYFYEPFLQAFDPELRKDLGVWYTPVEIVRYMVERVDTVLREELKLEDGLADPGVYVLDPCCGTGAFLTEVLKRIAKTIQEKGEDALGLYDVKKSAIDRVFGFEILPAPFVIAHLQMGLLLQNFGVPLSVDKQERAGVYLTNSLIGWEAPDAAKDQIVQLSIAELKAEQDAADRIKRDVPILVILGNPPYNAFAGVGSEAEQGLVEPYKEGLVTEWGVKKYNLDELYVRFFGLAEQRIAEKTGKGVICYISNFSYLDNSSFVIMRQHFLREFDQLWFDCMNGASRETGKLTPEGKPDPSVFSTEYNREGIKLGTTIGLMVRKSKRDTDEQRKIRFRQFWGTTKRSDLLKSIDNEDFDASYQLINPDRSNQFSFKPFDVSSHYLEWPKLVELCLNPPSNGLMEKRAGALIDIDRDALEYRMRMYYNSEVDWTTLKSLNTGLTKDAARFDAKKSRIKVMNTESYNSDHLLRYTIRPFETQWCYYSTVRPLWNEPRPALWAQCWDGNSFLLSRMAAAKDAEGPPFYFVKGLSDDHILSPDASCFPMQLIQSKPKRNKQATLIAEAAEADNTPKANLSLKARDYLKSLGFDDPDGDVSIAEIIWMHSLAIGYSPLYLLENANGIQQSWPRIPLPDNKNALSVSAKLGRKIAQLLDPEAPVPGVTSGKLRAELQSAAVISRIGGGVLNPEAGDLIIKAGWGHAGADGAVMPGKGKIVKRSYTTSELATIEQSAEALGITKVQAIKFLGDTTYDVYLNETAYWKNIPINVWNYTIGGYQVIKKWLSYREYEILQRALNREEARYVTNTARRIAAILLLESELNSNYETIRKSTYQWL